MKALKYISIIALALLGLVSCKQEEQEIFASKVTLGETSVDIPVGRTIHLKATVSPENVTDKTIIWSSSDESVATVQDGTITALKIGRTTITASCGMKSASCVVNVVPVEVEEVTLDKAEASLKVGETVTLTATLKPDDATDKTVTWSTSDEEVAVVKDGVVTALQVGSATITAQAGDKTAECAVSVVATEVTSVTLDKTSATLKAGETVTLTATVKPDDATDKTVTWTTSDESVATVTNGVVVAVKVGSATITARAGDKTATCAVTVVATDVTSVTLDKTSATLKIGETLTLTATVKPDDATDKTVTWSTSDASVATVVNGVVTAKKIGTATITAKAGDKTATCIIKVEDDVYSITEITCQVSPVIHPNMPDNEIPAYSLKKGESITILHRGISYKYVVEQSGQSYTLSPDLNESKTLIGKDGETVYAITAGLDINEGRVAFDNYNVFSFCQSYDLKNEELPLQVFRGEGKIQDGKLLLSFELMYSYLRVDLAKDVRSRVSPASETIRIGSRGGLFGDGEYYIITKSFYSFGGNGNSYIYDYSSNSDALKNQEKITFYYPIIPISTGDYSITLYNEYGSTIAIIHFEKFESQANYITRIDVSSKDITIGDGDFNNPPIITW